jgi:hypothetical protein
MSSNGSSKPNRIVKKTFFGITALITGIVSFLFSVASYGIVYLKISPSLFDLLNRLTALVFCSLTPIVIILGIIGFTRKNDSKSYSLIAITLVMIPFLILSVSLINSFRR